MIYTFKRNGAKIAVHTRTGHAHLLDSLTYDMLEQVTPPLSEELPMGMRYFFAKYDSGDLKQAYRGIREIYALEAEEKNDVLTGAVLCPETLGEKYTALLRDCAGKRDLQTPFELLLTVSGEDTTCEAVCIAREILPDARITLRCPLAYCKTIAGVDAYQAEAGDIAAFTGAALPDNTAVVVTFSAETDLSAQVTRLLDNGYRVCAVPREGMDTGTVIKAYELLSRTLTRRKRTDADFCFLPFTLTHDSGRWMTDDGLAQADMDILPGVYWQYGAQKHLAGYIASPEVLRCLAECALVLALN